MDHLPDHPATHPTTDPTGEAGAGSRRRDRGTPVSLALAWMFAVLGFMTVAVLQGLRAEAPAPSEAVESVENQDGRADERVPAPASDLTMVSKLMVNLFGASREGARGESEFQRAREAGELGPVVRLLTGIGSPGGESMAKTWSDRLRVSGVVADLGGHERALDYLDALESRASAPEAGDDAPPASFSADLDAFRAIYVGETIDDETRAGLVERHGWFAELAFVADLPPSDPAKDDFLENRWLIALSAVLLAIIFIGGMLTGACLLVTAFVLRLVGRMRPRFEAPAPGGSVYLETFAAFVCGFLVVMGVGVVLTVLREGGVVSLSDMGLESAVMGAQWGLGLAVFWPVLRGVPWSDARRALGWHAPRGVFREVVAGVMGYLCGLPLLLVGALITLVLVAIAEVIQGAEPEPIRTDAADLVSQASPWTLVLLGSLVVLWAPLVEETVFRGALYRHFRGRLHFVLSAPLTAFLFAFMHSYGVLFTPPLIMLGMVFASLREWRGSIIAPVVAHACQNTVAFTLMVVLFRLA